MWRALIAASLLGGCATMETVERGLGFNDEDRGEAPDTTLAAIMGAAPRTCPVGRTLDNAQFEAFGPQHDVSAAEIALVPMASDPSKAVRLRRLVMAPGGVIAWHTHETTQGAAMIVAGEATEIRNSCLDPIVYRAGDVAIEDAQTAHGWRNDGDVPTVVIVAHVVARN